MLFPEIVYSLLFRSFPGVQAGSRGGRWCCTFKLAQKRSRAGSWTSFTSVVSQRRSYGYCLCDSVLHSSWDSICVERWSLRNAGRTFSGSGGGSMAALVFRVGACFEVSLFCHPFFHSSPSPKGLLASVDFKQQKSTNQSTHTRQSVTQVLVAFE